MDFSFRFLKISEHITNCVYSINWQTYKRKYYKMFYMTGLIFHILLYLYISYSPGFHTEKALAEGSECLQPLFSSIINYLRIKKLLHVNFQSYEIYLLCKT
jgi:hypothetical protein